jgi:hypothetical protein
MQARDVRFYDYTQGIVGRYSGFTRKNPTQMVRVSYRVWSLPDASPAELALIEWLWGLVIKVHFMNAQAAGLNWVSACCHLLRILLAEPLFPSVQLCT